MRQEELPLRQEELPLRQEELPLRQEQLPQKQLELGRGQAEPPLTPRRRGASRSSGAPDELQHLIVR